MVVMSSSSISSTTGSLALELSSRRLLLQAPIYRPPAEASPSIFTPAISTGEPGAPESSSFDGNVVMILAVLLCALICALGVNSIVRCALRCTNRMDIESVPNSVARLAQIGLRRKAIRSLPTMVYSTGLKFTGTAPECTICLSEFVPGEPVRVLPKCNHGFHTKCIDRWLMARLSCPTCRRCLFGSCQKTSGCTAGASGSGQEPVRSIMMPLEREGLVATFQF